MSNKIYYTESIYVCLYPTVYADIILVPAGTRIPPLAIRGATFDICKSQVVELNKKHIDKLEKDIIRSNVHLNNILRLTDNITN